MTAISSPDSSLGRPAPWLAISSLAVGSFALVTTELLPIGILSDVVRDIGASDGQAGLMVTMPGFLAAVAAPLSIALSGQIDRRRLLLALLVVLVLSNVAAATATGLWPLLIGRFVVGLAVGAFWTLAGSLGPRLRPGPESVRATALILAGVSVGTVAGVPAGALIGAVAGWRWAFGAAAALGGIAIVAAWALLPPIPAEKSAGLRDVPGILRESRPRIGLVAAALALTGQFAAYTYVTPFLEQRSGMASSAIGVVLLASGVAGFFGNWTGGWLSGRSFRGSVITMAILLGAAILAADLTGRNAVAAILLVIVWGFGFGMLPISLQSWMLAMEPNRMQGIQALFVFVAQASIAGGALIGGLIVDHSGLDGALVSGSLAVLIAALVVAVPGWKRDQP